MQALLEDAIAGVVEDHPDTGTICSARRSTAPGTVYIALPSPISATTGRSGSASFDADRRRQAPADAAAAQPEKALRVVAVDELTNARAPTTALPRSPRRPSAASRRSLRAARAAAPASGAGERARLGAERLALGVDGLGRRTRAARARRALRAAVMRSRTAAVMSGSVALGSPRMATPAG